jgi:peroxiredoxin Q/BCP
VRRMTPLLVAALLLTGLVAAGLGTAGPAAALEVGQKAPDFTLPGPGGKAVKLSDLTAKGPVVVFTFIQAFTST